MNRKSNLKLKTNKLKKNQSEGKFPLRNSIFAIVVSLVFVSATAFGASYALFSKSIETEPEHIVEVGELVVTYGSGSETINIPNIVPMNDAAGLAQSSNVYSLNINNSGNLAYCYVVKLETNPEYLESGAQYDEARVLLDFNYIRYSINGGIPNSLGEQPEEGVYSGTLTPANSKKINIRLWVADPTIYALPNEAIGSEIHLNATVEGKACVGNISLMNTILSDNGGTEIIESKAAPDFSNIQKSDGSDTGLYATDGTNVLHDNYGKSYYYRGLKTELNNNLIFGGFQWKIVRINGDGSVRIIYNGICLDNECMINDAHSNTITGSTSILRTGTTYAHVWNATNANDNKYVGYMYGGANGAASTCRIGNTCATANETSSNAKAQLELWYETNILGQGFESVIVDRIICNDRALRSEVGGSATGDGYGLSSTYFAAYHRLHSNKKPTLACESPNEIGRASCRERV